jgi:hypothetical protein
MLRPATGNRSNFAIGGGQFQGTDMGTREGFSGYEVKQVNEKRIKSSQAAGTGIDLSSLTTEQKKLYS